MHIRLIYLIAFCFLYPFAVSGQADVWMKTITGNAISKAGRSNAFQPARPGFALYYAQAGSVNEPYLVYVPNSYDPAKPISLVVFLHGAILARESFQHTDPAIADEPIFSVGDADNAIVLFPFARSDYKWSGQSPVYENIIRMISQAETIYNIDKKRVYIGGISMGGIATFWFVNHRPEVFAGFYTFSAMPRLSGEEINFKAITNDKPLYSMNAKDDPGFSFNEVRGIYDQHKNEAKGWYFESVEAGGHRFIYGNNGKEYVKSVVGRLLRRQ